MAVLRAILAVTMLALISACASTPEATSERDAAAKLFEPVTRDAVLYVYRPDFGTTAGITTLTANGRLVGDSLPGTYFRIIVLPGRTRLDTLPPDSGKIEVETRGNDVVFVEMRTGGGPDGAPSTNFRRLPPEVAKPAILDCCTMLETWRKGQSRILW
jgi:hypothetical protein